MKSGRGKIGITFTRRSEKLGAGALRGEGGEMERGM